MHKGIDLRVYNEAKSNQINSAKRHNSLRTDGRQENARNKIQTARIKRKRTQIKRKSAGGDEEAGFVVD